MSEGESQLGGIWPMGRRRPWWGVATVVLAVILSAASARAEAPDSEPVLVLAAASLTDVLPRVGQRWEERSGREVEFSFAGSSRLARQIEEGARADVFVSASLEWLDHLEDRDRLRDQTRVTFLKNRLAWIQPADAPGAGPDRLAAVDGSALAYLALAGPKVPAGSYARSALRRLGRWEAWKDRVVSAGDVRRALEWVAVGEADAGIVYRTDAAADPRVRTAFVFPESSHPPIRYGAAVVRGARHPDAASRFVDFLSAPPALEVFASAGFSAMSDASASAGKEASSRATRLAADPRAEADVDSAVDPWRAIGLSVLVGLICVVLGAIPAVGFGWLLARRSFPGRSVLAAVLMAPLAMPPVVTGLLLLKLFGRRGVFGGFLESVGLHLPFSIWGAIAAALVVSQPLYLIAARSAFEAADESYDEVAATLGAGGWERFRRVTLPLALPGIAAGALLALARAMGEFGATIVLAGNIPGETQTIPLAIYTLLEGPGQRPAIWALVGASLLVTGIGVFGYERLREWQSERLER